MKGEETDREQYFRRVEKEVELNHDDHVLLTKAYQFAKPLHRGRFRKGGPRYITHPRAVGEILMDFGPSSVREQCTALLHDTYEDEYILPEMLYDLFGERIATAVISLSKKKNVLREHGRIEKIDIPDEVYFELLRVGCEMPTRRVKLGDRLHNLRTMIGMNPAGIRKKLDETYRYIIPLARWTHGGLLRAIQEQCRVVEGSIT